MTQNVLEYLISPGIKAEEIAFSPTQQPENRILREVVARVVALVAPLLHLWQVLSLPLCNLGCSITNQMGYTEEQVEPWATVLELMLSNAKIAYSSLLELPHKLITGPNSSPNYLGLPKRNYQLISERA